jgi:hypothetical protein
VGALAHGVLARAEENTPTRLVKLPFAIPKAMENTPLVYEGRPLLLLNHRDDARHNTEKYKESMYLYLVDLQTGDRIAEFGQGHSFVTGLVEGKRLHVFASEGSNFDWFQSLHHFWSDDLKTWRRELAIERKPSEHLFNCSVCRAPEGYLMAYESNEPVAFCFRFARSRDLRKWEPVQDLVFTGQRKEYSACPVIRYFAPYYYVIYLHAPQAGHNGWTSYVARSKNLETWQISPANPILEAGPGEGKNNSDVDLFEWQGRTYLVYATGDQATWGAARMAMYDGPMETMFEGWFPAGAKLNEVSTLPK